MGAAVWTPSRTVAMLAWFDFCLQSGHNFEATVQGHLKRSTHKTFSKLQVESKIFNILRKNRESSKLKGPGNEQLTSVTLFREKGSSCLGMLSEEMRDDIASLVCQYRGTTSGVIDPSSVDFLTDSANAAHEIVGPLSEVHSANVSGSAKNTQHLINDAVRNQPNDSTINSISNGISRADATTSSTESRLASETSPRHALERCRGAGSDETHRPILSLADQHKRELQQKDHQISTLQTLWQKESAMLQQRENKLKENQEALTTTIKHLKEARRNLQQAGNEEMEERSFLQDGEIWRLQLKIKQMEKVYIFDPVGALNAEKTIDKAMDQLRSELGSVMFGHDTTTPLITPSLESGTDLWQLVRTAACDSASEFSEESQLRIWIAKYGAQIVIRVLILAALLKWVFLTDFPKLYPEDTRLLQAYRAYAGIPGRSAMLRNLDRRVYHDVLHDTPFQEDLIPRQAKQLAARFSTTLAPLFVSSQSQSGGNVFNTWEEDEEVWKDRRSCLQRIFAAALKLKAETVTAQKCFEFALHPVGSLYQESRIEDPTGQNGLHFGDPQINPNVEYWLHASLNTYEIEASNGPGQLVDFTVQSNNFLTDRIHERSMPCLRRRNILMPKEPTTTTHSEHEHGANLIHDESSRLQITHASQNVELMGREIDGRRRGSDESTAAMRTTTSQTLEGQFQGQGNVLKEVPPGNPYGKRKKKSVSGTLNRKKGRRNVTKPKHPTCNRCSATFSSLSNLARHQQDDSCPRCLECLRFFRSMSDLRNHQKTQHPPEPEPPSGNQDEENPLENEFFAVNGALERTCEKCGTVFTSKRILSIHKTKRACRPCPKCGKILQNATYLDNHIREGHLEENSDAASPGQAAVGEGSLSALECDRCDRCDMVFASKDAQKAHRRKEICVQCRKCGKWLQRRSLLKSHILEEHPDPSAGSPSSQPQSSGSAAPNNQKNTGSSLVRMVEGGEVAATALSRKRTSQQISDSHDRAETNSESYPQNIYSKSPSPTESADDGKYWCSPCEKSFTRQEALDRHLLRACHTKRFCRRNGQKSVQTDELNRQEEETNRDRPESSVNWDQYGTSIGVIMPTGTASHDNGTAPTSIDQQAILDSSSADILNSVLTQARNSNVAIRPAVFQEQAQAIPMAYGPDAEDQGSIENEAIEALGNGRSFSSIGADRTRHVEQQTSRGFDSRQSFGPSGEAQISNEAMNLARDPAAPLLSVPTGIEPSQLFRYPPRDDTAPSFSVTVPRLPSALWESLTRFHHLATGPVDSQHP